MTKPNIVYVFADQLRYDSLGSSGNRVVKTPNIDKLAEQGVVFDRTFSSCPICSPYRGQMLTGLYSHLNGVVDNEYKMKTSVTTLPEALKAEGYHTGYVGKWHLGYGPYTKDKRYGFDYMASYNCNHQYYDVSYHENEKGPFRMDGWAPEFETSLAIRFIEDHLKENGKSPFALLLSWGPPHHPYDQYPEKYRIYDPEKMEAAPNVPEEYAEAARQDTADYYGNITGLDDQMGRILKALDDMGLSDNTILVFTSDHGDHIHCHGYAKCNDPSIEDNTRRASKATPYEESIHVPLIVRWPAKVSRSGRTNAFFSSVDIMPTLLSLCGVRAPEGMQGIDQSHLLLGGDGETRDSVYLEILGEGWPHRGKWVGYWRGVRSDRWMYARWYKNENGPLLFDVANDPYEMNNLYGNPEYARVQREMEARLKKWMTETKDPFDTGDRDPASGMLELGQEFTNEKWYR